MRVLILSCNTGEGHNSCAKAMKEYYDMHGDVCIIRDGLEFISPNTSRFLSWGHSNVYRHLPWLFKFGYAYAEKHPAVFREKSFVYRFLTGGSERLYQYICEGEYDTVICTHVFTALMLTDVLKTYRVQLVTGFVNTDYTCSPITKDSDLEHYFIPDTSLLADFECKNITDEKMIPSGIPIRQMFYTACDKKEAKKSVGVEPRHQHLLMMCGSMGCGPMKNLLGKLSVSLPTGWELSVVCGNNYKLERQLSSKYSQHQNIHIHGFVKNMGVMMDSADLYLTKPGGISVTEAAVKRLPMVLIDAVAGCEEYNRIYFTRNGGAKTGATINELTDICLELMKNEEKRRRMQAHLSEQNLQNAAEIIYTNLKKRTESSYDSN